MAGIIETLDSQLEQLFTPWNLWSTIFAFALLIVAAYPILASKEADTHPLLLSRQANVSAVRQPGESAVYRSIETPHGLHLRSGLNVKPKGAPKWSAGKDGDLRDIWRRVVSGDAAEAGQSPSQSGKLMTVYGREDTEEHDSQELTRQLNTIGKYIKQKGGACVAIYLPNSVELLLTVFAAAFYGFKPVLIPYGQLQDVILQLLQRSDANFLVANAGSISLADIKTQCKDIREVTWTVEKTSRHMDWDDSSANIPSSTWHDIVEQQSNTASSNVPDTVEGDVAPDVVTVWQSSEESAEFVALSQQNISAAVAAQISALPVKQRLGPNDVFLPADSLTLPYILTQTLAALFSGASVALNSVAGDDVNLALACTGIAPTVIAASATSLRKLHDATASSVSSTAKRFALQSQLKALDAGYMPPATLFGGFVSPMRTTLGKLPSKLRLVYAFQRVGAENAPLTGQTLSNLRASTGARIIHALAAPKVAGPIAQTLFYDYRSEKQLQGQQIHFGPPVSCLELKLVDSDFHVTVKDRDPEGKIVVKGPAVAGEEVDVGMLGRIGQDGTLAPV